MIPLRSFLRTATAGAVVGVTLVGGAYAGVIAVPGGTNGAGDEAGPVASSVGLQVGASKHSIAPRPDDYGGTWETDFASCQTLDPAYLEHLGTTPEDAAHLAHTGSPWPENPDCIYQGGFGLGPMNPVTAFDEELGLWVRTLAIGDGTDTVVLTIIDGEGWMWDYATKCDDCGAKQLGEDLGWCARHSVVRRPDAADRRS